MPQPRRLAVDAKFLGLRSRMGERETVAARIIEWARRGERDPARLRERVQRDAGAA